MHIIHACITGCTIYIVHHLKNDVLNIVQVILLVNYLLTGADFKWRTIFSTCLARVLGICELWSMRSMHSPRIISHRHSHVWQAYMHQFMTEQLFWCLLIWLDRPKIPENTSKNGCFVVLSDFDTLYLFN